MSPEVFVDIFSNTLQLIIILVSAIVLPSLFVGLAVAIFQAATSINEQTLSFLPRLLMTLISLIFMSHWLMNQLMDFTFEMAALIPQVIG